ncbi:hypothetical protein GQ600_20922 [Phytophthora cactorum]|nr:hypothetical protein GQ600_20922 [Phytophthora cactorum]
MVRGRAIRRGRCEECGDQRAVLECQQCRKVYTLSNLLGARALNATAYWKYEGPELNELAAESNKPKIVNVDLNSGPTLRALPSPPKQSTIQSAEPAAVKLKKPTADTELQSSKQDHIRTTTPSRGASTGKTRHRNYLRHVRWLVNHARDENSRNDELDFSTVEGDGALMNEAENDLDEQKESAESPAQPVTTAISEQAPAVETVSALPESISVPQGGSNDDEMSEQISNTIESNSEVENGAEAVATTEAASKQVKRDMKTSTGSVIAADSDI